MNDFICLVNSNGRDSIRDYDQLEPTLRLFMQELPYDLCVTCARIATDDIIRKFASDPWIRDKMYGYQFTEIYRKFFKMKCMEMVIELRKRDRHKPIYRPEGRMAPWLQAPIDPNRMMYL